MINDRLQAYSLVKLTHRTMLVHSYLITFSSVNPFVSLFAQLSKSCSVWLTSPQGHLA